MNFFDRSILAFFNQFSQRWWLLDKAVDFISGNDLAKGGVLAAFLWWVWFHPDGRNPQLRRKTILLICIGCFAAAFLSRASALALPFRVRPMVAPGLGFKVPLGFTVETVEDWSSFPSDHAALFFALAAGICFLSRGWGMLALAYVAGMICLPRIYLGLHYPTDVLAGAALGGAMGWVAQKSRRVDRLAGFLLETAMQKSPGLFYAAFFLATYLMATLFYDVRSVAKYGFKFLMTLIG